MTHTRIFTSRTIAATAALIALPLLAGCATETANTAEVSPSTSHSSSSSSSADSSRTAVVTITDGWAKSGSGMTGFFGTLTNHSDADLTITGLSSDAAELLELHEVTREGTMQAIDGPVTIPAHGTLTLAPGSNHIMLMNMTRELLAGDNVTVTLELSGGAKAPLDVLVKDYSGANESYDDLAHGEHGTETGHDAATGHDSDAGH